MTNDSSGSYGISIAGFGASFPTSSAKSGARATKELAAVTALLLKAQRQAALVARKQWEFQLKAAYPESPVYGPLAPVTQWDLPTKLTTKQTNVLQALMLNPDSKRLLAKSEKISAKIEHWKAKHPEAQSTVLTTRK